MEAHSSVFAWRTHGQRRLAGCSPKGLKRVGTWLKRLRTSWQIVIEYLPVQKSGCLLRHTKSNGNFKTCEQETKNKWKRGGQFVKDVKARICIIIYLKHFEGFPGGSEVKASAWNAGDLGSIPGSGRSPGERNGNPLQYSCLENPMEGGAW